MTLLFLCTGNSCRSPMAAAWFNQLAAVHGSAWHACSAGVHTVQGLPMSHHAQSVLQAAGIPKAVTAAHASQPLTRELVATADLIIALSHRHLQDARVRYPECTNKLKQLGEFANVSPVPDVADPYGGDRATYQACLTQIQQYIQPLLASLG